MAQAAQGLTLLLYCESPTPRLRYVLHFIAEYFSVDAQLTHDETWFSSFAGAKICYHDTLNFRDAVWIQPQGLLSQNNIVAQNISVFQQQGQPVFFKTERGYGFDVLSAIFYLLSRYEEYLPHQKDIYGRYDHRQSVAFQNNFLNQPLVNIWLEDLRKQLQQECAVVIPEKEFQFIPTYDVDIAWAYKHKGWKRNVGGALQALVKGNVSAIIERIKVLSDRQADPFDVYEYLQRLHEQNRLHPTYFFHVGRSQNKYDKAVNIDAADFKKLLQATAADSAVGLHPSWASNEAIETLSAEKEFLEVIIGKKITQSRQHYLKFDLPQTFRNLIQLEITDEYSMGWGGINGFRASVAAPFLWYDLEREEETTLRLHPFPFMEATSLHEQGYTAAQALVEMKMYYKIIQDCGGTYYTVWHPHFLSDAPLYKGWREAYEGFLSERINGADAQ